MSYLLYHLRWQLSTPILWYVVDTLGSGVYQTVVANAIGACIFYFVDKYIFKPNRLSLRSATVDLN